MKNEYGRSVSGKAVKALLERPDCQRDDELSRRLTSKIFKFADGGALVLGTERAGFHWFSRDELIRTLDEGQRTAQSHVLSGLFPQGKDFPDLVPSLAAEFRQQHGLPAPESDSWQSCLDKLDRVARKAGAFKLLEPDSFSRLVAYVIECLRQKCAFNLQMCLADDNVTWEPVLQMTGARDVAIALPVAKELYEWDRHSSLSGVIQGSLWKHL